MNWQEILTILVPLMGLMAWVYNRIERKADERFALFEKRADDKFAHFEKRADERHSLIEKRFAASEQRADNFENRVFQEFKEVKKEILEIRDRLTRLEGRFDERGYWESREWHKAGTEDKK